MPLAVKHNPFQFPCMEKMLQHFRLKRHSRFIDFSPSCQLYTVMWSFTWFQYWNGGVHTWLRHWNAHETPSFKYRYHLWIDNTSYLSQMVLSTLNNSWMYTKVYDNEVCSVCTTTMLHYFCGSCKHMCQSTHVNCSSLSNGCLQVILPGTNCCVDGGSFVALVGIPLLAQHSTSKLWHSQLKCTLAPAANSVLGVVVSLGISWGT